MLDVLPLALLTAGRQGSAPSPVKCWCRSWRLPSRSSAPRWSTESADLAQAALALQDSAQEYVGVESMLVPRVLR